MGILLRAGFFYFIEEWVLHCCLDSFISLGLGILLEGGYFIAEWVFYWELDSFISLEDDYFVAAFIILFHQRMVISLEDMYEKMFTSTD